jgi:hypothetical protein
MDWFDAKIHLSDVFLMLGVIATLYGYKRGQDSEQKRQHEENVKRLTALETKVQALTDWMQQWIGARMRS